MDLMKPGIYDRYLEKLGQKTPVKKTIKPNVDPKLIESAKRLLGDVSDQFVPSVAVKKGRKKSFYRLDKVIIK